MFHLVFPELVINKDILKTEHDKSMDKIILYSSSKKLHGKIQNCKVTQINIKLMLYFMVVTTNKCNLEKKKLRASKIILKIKA